MSTPTIERWSIGKALLGELGLDPAQPVIEWHRWGTTTEPEPEPFTEVPWAATGWSYLVAAEADATAAAAPGFDASGWPVGPAPLGNAQAPEMTARGWPAKATTTAVDVSAWLRRTVPATPGAPLRVLLRVDGKAKAYWNGALILDSGDSVGTSELAVYLPGASVLASNVLAVRGQDDTADPGIGDYFYLDASVVDAAAVPGGYLGRVQSSGGLLGYWTHDDTGTAAGSTVADVYAGHHGTHNGAATVGQPGLAPDGGTAIKYAGGGRTTVPHGTWMNSSSARLSIEFWAKLTQTTTAMLVERDNQDVGAGPGRVFQLRCYNGTLEWLVFTNLGMIAVGTPAPSLNVAHHIAAVFDGISAKLYVDGTLRATATFTQRSVATNGQQLCIGYSAANIWASGATIDALALHSVALSAAEVGSRMDPVTDTAPAPDPTPGPEPVAGGWVLDPERTAALNGYTATYARQRVTEDTGPLSVSAALVRDLAGALPTVGERFRLTVSEAVATALGLAEEDRPRFTGEVTDAQVDTGGYVAVVGIGRRARALAAPVGGTILPRESAGARVARLLAEVAAQVPDVVVGTIDATGAEVLRRDPEPAEAGVLLGQVQVDSAGQLVEQRDGTLDWHGPDHRRGATALVSLSGATELLKPFSWAQSVGDVVNDVTVVYGKDQATVRVTDDDSADLATGLGLHSTQVQTTLADAGGAYALGTDLVGRRARPTWRLPECRVELVRSLDPAKRATVLALRHGDLLTLTDLPAGGPYTSTPRGAFVEGAVESCTRTAWELSLSVADPALAGVSLRWIDIPDAETWDSLAPDLTWLDLATAEPTDL